MVAMVMVVATSAMDVAMEAMEVTAEATPKMRTAA